MHMIIFHAIIGKCEKNRDEKRSVLVYFDVTELFVWPMKPLNRYGNSL